MDDIRKKIDSIDRKLMELLDERFSLTKKIGEYKNKKNQPIYNEKREKEILEKANNFKNNNAIKDIYKQIFKTSKFYQTKYGLIGRKISYSLSPLIYKEFGLNTYELIETDDFINTMEEGKFKGVNVTIPYKTEAYKYLENLDESAIKTKTVNTICNGKGYNTDYLSLKEILNRFDLKKVIIIGNGATSRSVKEALDINPVLLVRNIRSENEYLISDYERFTDYDCIINTTPYGTYPNIEKMPLFPLDKFTKLKLVFDVIYNPLHSPLILEAKKHNINYMNGLELLVMQASISYKIFTSKEVDYKEVFSKLRKKLYNIVLIGPSYSGKSTIAKRLSQKLNKKLVDIDENLKRENKDLETILKNHPESYYRDLEKEEVIKHAYNFNQVIATGGGVVTSSEAMEALQKNSIIIFINPPLDLLISRIDNTRPLIKKPEDLINLYNSRKPLYLKYCDIEVKDEKEMMERINEYFNN
ncbi:MAG TPA: hypothetical protein GXZ48_02180 [Acholeplasmataceae bacterium]|nr:hypothetical protein [Acholeplasmataceae bacterium]